MNIQNLRVFGLAAAASIALAGCATSSPGYGSGYGSTSPGGYYGGSTANCYDCGTITRIEQFSSGGSAPQATGAVLGGLVGAAAGREIADDKSSGRQNTATVAGAVAGAVAGNAIQNRIENRSTFNVHVRMNDGRTTVVSQNNVDGLREGSAVRVYDGKVWTR